MIERLGPAIKRLRVAAGFTLRGFAQEIGISAAHQSDIEHGRRMPSEKVLRDTAEKVGVTFESLQVLDTRMEQDVQDWVQQSPEGAHMLRRFRESGQSPREILKRFEEMLKEEEEKKE